MSHSVTPNFTLTATSRPSEYIWALVRTMQKAGWAVLASSFGNTLNQKYITGRYGPSGSTGSAASITTAPAQRMTLTGLTGMEPKHCGDWIETSGASSGANNGAFLITEYNSPTSVNVFNPSAVAPDANNGAISWTHRPFRIEPSECSWSLGATLAGPTGSAAIAAGATPDRMQITGMSGLTSSNVGDYVTTTGATTGANNGTWVIARVLSATSCEVFARGNASPYTGTITWTLKEGTGASQATGSAASITTKPNASEDDFTVTGLSHANTNSGAAGVIGTIASYPNYNLMVVNNLSGCTAADTGKWLTTSGASDGGNNGEFLIVKYESASSLIVYNPNRVQGGAGTITWSIRPGPEEGNYLSIDGASNLHNNGTVQIVKVLSATSCLVRIPNGTASDGNNGAIGWNHRDPSKQSIATINTAGFDRGAWVILQGPSMIKMPFTTGVYGAESFVRGEKVTQAATGAEGELVGITMDSTGAGWAVIATQLRGTGTSYDDGWDLSEVQGATTSAKFTPTGIQEWRRETMFALNSSAAEWDTSGWAATVFYRKDTEQRQRFYLRAFNSSCTALTHPGASSATDSDGNTFPAKAYCFSGIIASTGDYWSHTSQNPDTVPHGKAQLVAANAIRRQGLTPDGTWFLHFLIPSVSYYIVMGFHRMDNTEEGEIDPWVTYAPTAASSSHSPTRTGQASGLAISTASLSCIGAEVSTQRAFMMSRALGTGYSAESVCVGGIGLILCGHISNVSTTASIGAYSSTVYAANTYAHIVKSSQGTKRYLEPIHVGHINLTTNTDRFVKGKLRWWFFGTWIGTVGFSTFGGKKLFVGGAGGSTSQTMPVFMGPWDGVSEPVGT